MEGRWRFHALKKKDGEEGHTEMERDEILLCICTKKISPLNNQNFTFKKMKINLEKFGATSFSLY